MPGDENSSRTHHSNSTPVPRPCGLMGCGRRRGRIVTTMRQASGRRPALTLADEHALLLEEVAVRAGDLLTAIAGDRWAAPELEALVGYLRAEGLRQAADQEWLVTAGHGAEGFAPPARDQWPP